MWHGDATRQDAVEPVRRWLQWSEVKKNRVFQNDSPCQVPQPLCSPTQLRKNPKNKFFADFLDCEMI